MNQLIQYQFNLEIQVIMGVPTTMIGELQGVNS